MKHAKGLSRLAEFRGLDCYRNEFDSILLKASRGIIIMNSIFSGQECFLASERWHLAMKEHSDTFLPAGLGNLIEEFIAYFTFAPSLIHRLYALKQADPASPETWTQMWETLTRTLEMQHKLDAWYDRYSCIAPPPRETISPSGDKLHPMVLSYSDPTNASVFCGYYSYMVIIHEIFKACGYPGEHEAMTVYFRDQICKSVEYNGRGLLGPYQMAFPLRVAFEVAGPVVKSWIKGWLIQFSNVYPALQPQRLERSLPD
ncbi:uncharacterized protein ACHE_31057S [Aspergillus chevalieri]|uniref:C6 finger domain protein n=1 Tax=Aspergillus chevalieri TaxID=182096 RepID=A0A7R7VLW3_ASPCH|nr:uncharacterized protein ACHE_31057S [Aspergillus chevalieri]BCR87070.1 hypothetical protein ACHE_31057S [Aspergillus chevalieri]